MNETPQILLLPGWRGSGSGPGHWQARWQARHGDVWVQQHDWQRPLRGDWMAQLEQAVLAAAPNAPVLLAAHSLGCLLVAAWAAHSRHAARVAGALLVAPSEIERDDLRQTIPGWSPPLRQRLPFAATVVAASDDPYAAQPYARQLARDWGARFVDAGPGGHLNAESGLGDWPAGRARLLQLLKETDQW